MISIGYITVGIGVALALATLWRYVHIKELPPELIPERSAGQILAQEWTRLIPLLVLGLIVILRSGFKVEVLQVLDPLLPFGEVPILKALTNRIIQAIIVVTILTLAFPEVRRQFKGNFG